MQIVSRADFDSIVGPVLFSLAAGARGVSDSSTPAAGPHLPSRCTLQRRRQARLRSRSTMPEGPRNAMSMLRWLETPLPRLSKPTAYCGASPSWRSTGESRSCRVPLQRAPRVHRRLRLTELLVRPGTTARTEAQRTPQKIKRLQPHPSSASWMSQTSARTLCACLSTRKLPASPPATCRRGYSSSTRRRRRLRRPLRRSPSASSRLSASRSGDSARRANRRPPPHSAPQTWRRRQRARRSCGRRVPRPFVSGCGKQSRATATPRALRAPRCTTRGSTRMLTRPRPLFSCLAAPLPMKRPARRAPAARSVAVANTTARVPPAPVYQVDHVSPLASSRLLLPPTTSRAT